MPATLFVDYRISDFRALTTDGRRYFYKYSVPGEAGITMAVFYQMLS